MTEDEMVCRTLRRETDAAAESRIAAADGALKRLTVRQSDMGCIPSRDGMKLVTAYGDVVCTSDYPEFINWLHACVWNAKRAARNAHAAVKFAESVLGDRRNYKREAEIAQAERAAAVSRLKLLTEELDGKPGEVRQFYFWLDGIRADYSALAPARDLARDVGGRVLDGMPFASKGHRKILAHIEYTTRNGINLSGIIKRGLLAAYDRHVFFYVSGMPMLEAGGLQEGGLDPEVLARHPGMDPDGTIPTRLHAPSGNGDFGDQ